jgi:hypothetical protein
MFRRFSAAVATSRGRWKPAAAHLADRPAGLTQGQPLALLLRLLEWWIGCCPDDGITTKAASTTVPGSDVSLA